MKTLFMSTFIHIRPAILQFKHAHMKSSQGQIMGHVSGRYGLREFS